MKKPNADQIKTANTHKFKKAMAERLAMYEMIIDGEIIPTWMLTNTCKMCHIVNTRCSICPLNIISKVKLAYGCSDATRQKLHTLLYFYDGGSRAKSDVIRAAKLRLKVLLKVLDRFGLEYS